MVSVADYLKKLLFQYDCLVVPELGGFILHYIPATFVENTGLYMPPRKKIAFNEALKLDDGLLINYMMLHEGCKRDEAFQAIRHFVEALKQDVRQERIFAIEGLGLFSENEEGKLQFDPEIRHNFQGESYGFQPVAARLANEVEEEEKHVAIIKLPQGSPIAVEAEEVPANVVAMPVTDNRKHYLAWAAALLFICSLGVISVKKSSSRVLSSLNPIELFIGQKDESTPVVIRPVTGPSIAPVETKKAESVVEMIPETKPAATPVVEPVIPKAVAEPIAPVGIETKREGVYYLAIAGSFASEKNARRLVKRLRQEGFGTAYIIPQTKKRDLIKVAAIGSTDRTEIMASLAQVSKLSGSHAWVSKVY